MVQVWSQRLIALAGHSHNSIVMGVLKAVYCYSFVFMLSCSRSSPGVLEISG